MKKLKLSELNLGSAEVLTRKQLKKVLGGDGPGGSGCPPDTYMCACSINGSQHLFLDTHASNIIEATYNAGDYCSGLGYPEWECSIDWGC